MEIAASQSEVTARPTAEQIDRWIEETLHLARTEPSPERFHAELTDRLLRVTAGVAAAVWTCDGEGRWNIVAKSGRELSTDLHANRSRVVANAMAERRTASDQIPAGASNGSAGLRSHCSPVVHNADTPAVIELVHDQTADDGSREAMHSVVAEFCEIAMEFYTCSELRQLRNDAELWSRYEAYIARVHGSLDLRATAFAIANDGRALLECDRLSVLVASGNGSRTFAVSGVDTINRRSAAIRALEPLAGSVMRMREPLWYDESAESNPPQLELLLRDYLEHSPARALVIVPLQETGRDAGDHSDPPFAALIVEKFDADWQPDVRQRIGAVAGQSASALANALRHRAAKRLPIVGRLFAGNDLSEPSSSRKWAIGIGIVAAVFIALWLIPGDFDVSARGQLLPENRCSVYAPADGIVRLSLRKPNDEGRVTDGQIVAHLRSPELDREFTRIVGELRTVQKQLEAIGTARKREDTDSPRAKQDAKTLSARERELEQTRDNLQRDLKLLTARSEDLKVRSPLTGSILTWDVVRKMHGRPVRRGDVLMQVGRLDGEWELELLLPERQAGYVRDARRDLGDKLPVTFQSANDPGRVHRGHVKFIARTADVTKEGLATVRVIVAVENSDDLTLRPGATVTAKFHCGRRSIGYVWFHDIIDTTRTWLAW